MTQQVDVALDQPVDAFQQLGGIEGILVNDRGRKQWGLWQIFAR